jgi:uncharacterized protein (TIGR03435 family)
LRHLGRFAWLGLVPVLLCAEPRVGDRPPEIHFDKLLPEQPAANARFDSLAGKAVVLEMWATWCGVCVDAIPHFNELAEKFKGRPVVFLSVTDEDPAVVEAFLKKRPIGGWVGIAHAASSVSAYGVDRIPATFLIDATGKLAGNTDPDRLSAPMLEDLIAGRPLPPVELTIRTFAGTNSISSRRGRNSLEMHGMTLRSIVSDLWDIPPSRITGQALENDRTAYDLSLSIPVARPSDFRSWAREVIAAAFHLKVSREKRDIDVWILAKTSVTPAVLEPPGAITDFNNVGISPAPPPAVGFLFKLVNTDVSFIAQFMEGAVGKPVIDETGIAGRYDFYVSYTKAAPEGLIEAMRNSGFKLEPGRRTIEFLAVSQTE